MTPSEWLRALRSTTDSVPAIAGTLEIVQAVAGTEGWTTKDTVDELGNALRELHDFAVPSADYRYVDMSRRAFDTAAELLKRLGY